jgi:hypothetical protein
MDNLPIKSLSFRYKDEKRKYSYIIFDNKIQVFQFEKFTKNGAGNFLSLFFL